MVYKCLLLQNIFEGTVMDCCHKFAMTPKQLLLYNKTAQGNWLLLHKIKADKNTFIWSD